MPLMPGVSIHTMTVTMKKIGIVGGVGWPSTIDYYKAICLLSQAYWGEQGHSNPLPTPEIAIESLNMNFTVNNRGSDVPGSWLVWDQYFQMALKSLESGGAELLVIASMTPHTRLAKISDAVNIPVLSIYDAIGHHCSTLGVKNLLVLGTRPTMTSQSFVEGTGNFGINSFYPQTNELKAETVRIIENLYHNRTEGASEMIKTVVRESVSLERLVDTAVCLGCTELPTAFDSLTTETEFNVDGITYLNSTAIHSKWAFKACIK